MSAEPTVARSGCFVGAMRKYWVSEWEELVFLLENPSVICSAVLNQDRFSAWYFDAERFPALVGAVGGLLVELGERGISLHCADKPLAIRLEHFVPGLVEHPQTQTVAAEAGINADSLYAEKVVKPFALRPLTSSDVVRRLIGHAQGPDGTYHFSVMQSYQKDIPSIGVYLSEQWWRLNDSWVSELLGNQVATGGILLLIQRTRYCKRPAQFDSGLVGGGSFPTGTFSNLTTHELPPSDLDKISADNDSAVES